MSTVNQPESNGMIHFVYNGRDYTMRKSDFDAAVAFSNHQTCVEDARTQIRRFWDKYVRTNSNLSKTLPSLHDALLHAEKLADQFCYDQDCSVPDTSTWESIIREEFNIN